jgi:hypothetical protein
MLSFFWIPACAGMTICVLISIRNKTGHTREEPARVQTGAGIQALKELFTSSSLFDIYPPRVDSLFKP